MRQPTTTPDPEQQVVTRWHACAERWQKLIDTRQLASRRITNPAIEQAIHHYQPRAVLDVGCGEGWLARRLTRQGIRVTGVDTAPPLIEHARHQDSQGRYLCIDYHSLPGPLQGQQFDLAVCNFSLFGKDSVARLIDSLVPLLRPGGSLLIQTLHPFSSCQGDYRDGWRQGQWPGLDADLGEAPPWYFRTLASWLTLLQDKGLSVRVEEPIDPDSRQPLSLLLHADTSRIQESNRP